MSCSVLSAVCLKNEIHKQLFRFATAVFGSPTCAGDCFSVRRASSFLTVRQATFKYSHWRILCFSDALSDDTLDG